MDLIIFNAPCASSVADDARCVAAFAGFCMLASKIGFLSERATSRSRYQRSRYLLDRLVH